MYKLAGAFLTLLPLVSLVAADVPLYGQCGGATYTGETTCAAGSTCVYSNPYYSQCLASSATVSSTSKSTSASSSSAAPSSSASSPGLNVLAKAKGKLYFGSATDNGELTDTPYVTILSNTKEFGQITPGNSMKWDATEPSRGVFTFTAGDVISNLAKGNGQLLRAHALLWHNQLPSWVSSGGFSQSELTSIIQTHIAGVAGHYKGIPYAWDVVNEPINDDGTLRQSIFYTTFGGTGYIDVAFKAARAADPNAKLYINEYNLEYAGSKYNTLLSLVKTLVANGVPIDGVGFQGHLIVGSVPSKSTLVTALQAFTALGLEVAFTELDIRLTLPATTALLAQQKTDYQTVVSACAAVTKCVGVTVWDYTDKYSWVPSTFSGQGAALPWDENLVKKPAYDGIVAALS